MAARRPSAALSLLALAASSLSACTDRMRAGPDEPAPTSAATAQVVFTSNVRSDAQDIPVDRIVTLAAPGARLHRVTVTSSAGSLPGSIRPDGSWAAHERLEPGTTYTLTGVAVTEQGRQRHRRTFTTADLTLDEQTYADIAPLAGETVGVGMPVIVSFDVPVTDRAAIERHLSVTSAPAQKGAWRWFSESEVHWRPTTYWKPGSDVTVDLDINGVAAGNGIYGQEDRHVEFHVGDSVISKVDARTHQMRTFINGELAKTTPITTGKAGFTTRSGVKVIIEKFRTKRMNSETVGIPRGSAEAYDIDDVEYAMRVTYSGEFLHAAPWSVGSQGSANVSHGCTGMSTEDAAWIYDISKRGDVVEYTGTDRPMTLDNGYGDWNLAFSEYAEDSALR